MIRDKEMLDQFIDVIHRYVRERLLPMEEQVAADDRMPTEIVDEMREMGMFGLSIPEKFGGLGFTLEEEVRIAMEFGYTSPAFRSVFGTNVGIGSQAICIDGTPEQKDRFLPGFASGEIIGSFALTEPDVGSDAGSVRTRASKVEGGYILDGTKRYITNAPLANVFSVMARTDPDSKNAHGVSAFVVDAKSDGISLGKPERKMGQQGTLVSDVVFSGCFVPAENLIGGVEGMGFKTAMKVLDRGRIHISAVCVGAAKRLIDEALAFGAERKQFGKPIVQHQLVQAMVSDSIAEMLAAEALVLSVAQDFDDGNDIKLEAAAAKMFASEMVGRVADKAVQIHGGAGYISEYPVERFYRDVRLFRIYEGTTQIQQLVIAREALGRRAA